MAENREPEPQAPNNQPELERPETETERIAPFPVVGIGASAGGLEAFRLLLQHLPADTGMAFVFVQHLAPQHSSLLASILTHSTTMGVTEAEQKTRVQPNHIYVIPPNTLMRIADSILELAVRPDERGAPRPIDYFFRSLAKDRQSMAVGVLLSGADADGALGLQAIREEGGIAIVQNVISAKNPEMPRYAIAAGTVDLVLSPEEIGAELGRIAHHPALAAGGLKGLADADAQTPDGVESPAALNNVFQLLRRTAGVDFSGYKSGTMRRRIARRMLLGRHENLDSYLALLDSNRAELLALSEDLLIHVTSFFRDVEAFDVFEHSILPQLLKTRFARRSPDNTPFRVWVPGCSTGQEVYSIAMCLIDTIAAAGASFPIQIFGTDLSEHAIASARNAVYPESEVSRLTPERQARFFVRAEGGYQITKSLREMCVFARQNLLADPPFSRLNLISCRNVLIYLGAAMQRHVIATFHYALQPDGCLWLGHSESLRDFPDMFSQIDKRHKFYMRNQTRDNLSLNLIRRGKPGTPPQPALALFPERERASTEGELEKTAERIVLSEFGPAWVVVNQNLEILNSRGDVSPYLQIPSGRASLSLLRMARDEIRGELTRLLNRAKAGEFHLWSSVLHKETEGGIGDTRIEVRRIAPAQRGLEESPDAAFLVVFFPANRHTQETPASAAAPGHSLRVGSEDDVDRLKQELNLSTQRMQTLLTERDTANQELTSANEEIQSSNEELQSINEELETSKEELQSSNEELNTVNEELQTRNQELVRLSDDLANLLSSTTMPILMLDNELRIRRVTQAAERLFNIRQSDVGRPIGDLRLRLSEDDLDSLVRRVIDTLTGEEIELLDRDGHWHLLRVRPYRTADNRIEGAVLVMIDIDQMRRAQSEANAARIFAESLVECVQTPLLVLYRDFRIRMANRAFLAAWHLRRSEVENRTLKSLGENWVSADLEAALGRLAAEKTSSELLECEHNSTDAGKRLLLINAVPVRQDAISSGEFQILLAATDITDQRRAEQIMLAEQERLQRSVRQASRELAKTESALHGSQDALRRSREELRALSGSLLNAQDQERRRVSRELHDDVGQNMAKLQFDIERLEQSMAPELKREKKRLLLIRDTAGELSNDLRKIAYTLHPSSLDHLGLTVALRAFTREFSQRTGIRVKMTTSQVASVVPPEVASCFYRVTQEGLRNVAKHAPEARLVAVKLIGKASKLTLKITDNGPGFEPDVVRGNGGLGLISIEERARLIHASFELSAAPGKGTAITVVAPLG